MSQESTPREPGGVRMALTLGIGGLISGLALVTAYEATLPRIKANEVGAIERAVVAVVPGAKVVKPLALTKGGTRELAPGDESPHVYGGYDEDGGFRGYAVLGEGPGFQDTIRLIYGYDPEARRITGLEVIDSRETPGLGDKIMKDAHFRGEFQGLAVDPEVELIKGHGEAPNQVDAITGATISSRAVIGIVNSANHQWVDILSPPTPDGAPSSSGNPSASGSSGREEK